MFEFQIDRDRRLIMARVRGFWDRATAESYARAHLGTVKTLGLPIGAHLVLADFDGLVPQSQETVACIQQLIDGNVAKRIALVAPAALSRMQARRLIVRPNVRVFADLASAEHWLFDDEPLDRTG